MCLHLFQASEEGLLYNDMPPLLSSKNETQSLFMARVCLKYYTLDSVNISCALFFFVFLHTLELKLQRRQILLLDVKPDMEIKHKRVISHICTDTDRI